MLEIALDRSVRGAVEDELSLLEQDRPGAEAPHRGEVVADEDDGATLLRDVAHLAEALLLELRVADGEHLVDEQDLRLEVRGDGEREPHLHAARVALHRRVEEALDARELDDLVEPARDLRAAHAEDRAVQEDVLAPGELGMEARADLEQRADAAAKR